MRAGLSFSLQAMGDLFERGTIYEAHPLPTLGRFPC